MRVVVVYRPETAMRAEVMDTDGVRVLQGEGMVLFEPTVADGTYQRPRAIPIRFVSQVYVEGAPERNLLVPPTVVDLADARSRRPASASSAAKKQGSGPGLVIQLTSQG